jgi:hypothetical protein
MASISWPAVGLVCPPVISEERKKLSLALSKIIGFTINYSIKASLA